MLRNAGPILYAAFAAMAAWQQNSPSDFPSVEVATEATSTLIGHPGFHGLVAEDDGRVVGSNFMDGRSRSPASGRSTSTPRRGTGTSAAP